MKFEKKPMVNWYNPKQLAATGLKSVISSIFGNFADKRDIQSVLSEKSPYNYGEGEEIWVDYISDLGDGFDATYTMAHLMAKDHLEAEGKSLLRGKILIMGGDEVYPTPEKEEYENRLQGPYNAAMPWDDTMDDKERPHLFALPGNHDWYDGLTNFLKLFCQGRSLGNWQTQQKRSYFALQLPHHYWLWGIDVQLNADIDNSQQDYFAEIAKNEMKVGDKIILCTAEPAWVYYSLDKKNQSYSRLQFFIDNFILCQEKGSPLAKQFKLVAILTGDFHHYSRYEIKDEDGKGSRHLITAGGGGAFMHPTHVLKNTLKGGDKSMGTLKSVFPTQGESRRLAIYNLYFPVMNWDMVAFVGVFHLLTAWFLQSTSKYGTDEVFFMDKLAAIDFSWQGIGELFQTIGETLSHNPSVVLLNLVLVATIFLFTDTKTGKGKWNYVAGGVHSFLQFTNLYVLIWLFSSINLHHWGFETGDALQALLFAAEMIVIGGLMSGIIFGLYLLVSTLLFLSHPTEAYSSLQWTGYKNFLRMHITSGGITIYPIGVKKVVTNWKNVNTPEKPRFEGAAIEYSLIENPIYIKDESHE